MPGLVVIIVRYSRYGGILTTLFLFGYAALIKTLFLVDYTWMSSQSEATTLAVMYTAAGAWVGTGLLYDAIWRLHNNVPVVIPYLSGEDSVKEEQSTLDTFLTITFVLMAVLHGVALVVKTWR